MFLLCPLLRFLSLFLFFIFVLQINLYYLLFFVFFLFGVLWAYWICGLMFLFITFGEFRIIIWNKIFLRQYLCSLHGTLVTYMSSIWYCPTCHWGSGLFFLCFNLDSSSYLSLSSLVNSSAMSNLLLSPSREYFICVFHCCTFLWFFSNLIFLCLESPCVYSSCPSLSLNLWTCFILAVLKGLSTNWTSQAFFGSTLSFVFPLYGSHVPASLV